jgi:hypothetical protein
MVSCFQVTSWVELRHRLLFQGIDTRIGETDLFCPVRRNRCLDGHESTRARALCDAVLVAAGRQSNTAKVGLEKAGVQTGERGIIAVNEHFQTNIENIYAAGDVIGFPALASPSAEQADRRAYYGRTCDRVCAYRPGGHDGQRHRGFSAWSSDYILSA